MNKKKADIFKISSYSISDDFTIYDFFYSIQFNDGTFEVYKERLRFLKQPGRLLEEEKMLLHKAVSAYHIAAGTSYFKMYFPEKIQVMTHDLSKSEADFWNIIYTKGMGEYYYKNKIKFRNFPGFEYKNKIEISAKRILRKQKALVLIGGGKDSLVSVFLVKRAKIPFTLFSPAHPQIRKIISLIEAPNIEIERNVDEKMIDLSNKNKVFKGHIPISVLYVLQSLIAAILYNFAYIVISQERSSDYGNLFYDGYEINHQWSKSSECEILLRKYISNFITPEILYFSILRPFSEIEIVRLFTEECKEFFAYFSSCNRNWTKDGFKYSKPFWCCCCAKCVFVFILLSAYLPKEMVVKIFGKNLFEAESLLPLFKDLLGIGSSKPFDCVGTPAEAVVALFKAYNNREYENTPVMKLFEREVLSKGYDISKLEKEVFSYGDDSNIPEIFKKVLKKIHKI